MEQTLLLRVLVFVALAYCIEAGEALPTYVQSGLMSGRSGHVIVESTLSAAEEFRDAAVIFSDASGLEYGPPADFEPQSLFVTHFADVTCRNLGVTPRNLDYTPPQNLVTQTFLRKPRANVLLAIDSIGSDLLQKFNLANLRSLTKTPESGSHGRAIYKLEYNAYPHHSLAVATSLATGQFPSKHGIVSSSWPDATGKIVRAFESGQESWPMSATVADVVSQSYQGQALTLSVSADSQLAAAHCAHPRTMLAHSEWNNYCFTFDSEAFHAVHSASRPGLTSSPSVSNQRMQIERTLSLRSRDIVRAFAGADSVLSLVEDGEVKATVDGELVYIQYGSARSHAVSFDMNNPLELRVLAELQYMYSLPSLMMSSPAMETLIRDDTPDSVVLSISSLTNLADKYGRDSNEYIAALHLVDAIIPKLRDRWHSLWRHAVASQLVLMGSHPSAFPSAASPDVRKLTPPFQSVFPEVADFAFYPFVYLSSSISADSFAKKCEELAVAAKSVNYQVYCATHPVRSTTAAQNTELASRSLPRYTALAGDASSNSSVSDADVQRFQIAMWISIIMAFAVFVGAYSIAFMTFKKDSLIYGSFNPHWEDRKRK